MIDPLPPPLWDLDVEAHVFSRVLVTSWDAEFGAWVSHQWVPGPGIDLLALALLEVSSGYWYGERVKRPPELSDADREMVRRMLSPETWPVP